MSKYRVYFEQPHYWSVEVEAENDSEAEDLAWDMDNENGEYGDAECKDVECLEKELKEEIIKPEELINKIPNKNDADLMKQLIPTRIFDQYQFLRGFCKDELKNEKDKAIIEKRFFKEIKEIETKKNIKLKSSLIIATNNKNVPWKCVAILG